MIRLVPTPITSPGRCDVSLGLDFRPWNALLLSARRLTA